LHALPLGSLVQSTQAPPLAPQTATVSPVWQVPVESQQPPWQSVWPAPHAVSQGTVVDGELLIGEKIGPLVIEPAAGKSPGEVALHWPERRLLFIGDAVIGNPPGQCGLLREKVMDDPARLRSSVRNLLELDFDALLFGDGVPILTDAHARLEALVATFPR